MVEQGGGQAGEKVLANKSKKISEIDSCFWFVREKLPSQVSSLLSENQGGVQFKIGLNIEMISF